MRGITNARIWVGGRASGIQHGMNAPPHTSTPQSLARKPVGDGDAVLSRFEPFRLQLAEVAPCCFAASCLLLAEGTAGTYAMYLDEMVFTLFWTGSRSC